MPRACEVLGRLHALRGGQAALPAPGGCGMVCASPARRQSASPGESHQDGAHTVEERARVQHKLRLRRPALLAAQALPKLLNTRLHDKCSTVEQLWNTRSRWFGRGPLGIILPCQKRRHEPRPGVRECGSHSGSLPGAADGGVASPTGLHIGPVGCTRGFCGRQEGVGQAGRLSPRRGARGGFEDDDDDEDEDEDECGEGRSPISNTQCSMTNGEASNRRGRGTFRAVRLDGGPSGRGRGRVGSWLRV